MYFLIAVIIAYVVYIRHARNASKQRVVDAFHKMHNVPPNPNWGWTAINAAAISFTLVAGLAALDAGEFVIVPVLLLFYAFYATIRSMIYYVSSEGKLSPEAKSRLDKILSER